MRKREKRTDRRRRRRGLWHLSNLEIDVRAHGMRPSGNCQIYGDEKFGVGRVDDMAQRRRWWIRGK